MNTNFLFFSGKGGVGKTSMACATAVRLADEGRPTLIVTTDPASNLADVFEQPIGHAITPIGGVPNLWAMEIDPDQATQEYIDRAMAPIRDAFPPQIVQVMEEQMSGPCTAEVAAFDRFVNFLDLPPATRDAPARFDTVIFDTAPTGHTIRLLELPAEWSRSIDMAAAGSGQTCLGPAAAIRDAKHKYDRALATMRDSGQTTFIFVLQPEEISIKETTRAIAELGKLGIGTQRVLVNGLIPPDETDPLFVERRAMQQHYLAQIARAFMLPRQHMYLLAEEIVGVARLREVAAALLDGQRLAPPSAARELVDGATPGFARAEILSRILPTHGTRALFFTGKGGVGKTAVSCITAVWLARQGYKTLLLTTDPAAHVGDVLGVPVTDWPAPVPGVPGLWATKIDPKAAGAAYKTRILDDARRRGRPAASIQVMAEELDSPCTEEMAAFDKFIEYAAQDEWQVTVFDTAPTGHTLRLLELPVDWSKQIDIKIYASVNSTAADDIAKARFSRVIERLRDPAQSTFAYVMYPESTPIIEAYRAAEELRTVGIAPALAVANQVLPAAACTTPFSRARRAMQQKYLAEIGERFSVPVLRIPLLPYEIKGLDLLAQLGETLYGALGSHRVDALVGAAPIGRCRMKRKVLFLCTGNSARSQMAEAIVNARLGAEWEAVSAGTRPTGAVHPAAIRALQEIGIAHTGRSKSMDEFRGVPFDLVVTVCDDAAENCPVWLGQGRRVHLGFPDPAQATGTEDQVLAAFRAVRNNIARQVPVLLDAQGATEGSD